MPQASEPAANEAEASSSAAKHAEAGSRKSDVAASACLASGDTFFLSTVGKQPKAKISDNGPTSSANANKEKQKLQKLLKPELKLYCIVLYCIVLYCIVLYCIVLYCIVLYLFCIVWYRIVLYGIVLRLPGFR